MSSPDPQERLQFRLSPLGQPLLSLNNPSDTLKQLTLKRLQYEEIQRKTDLAQTLRLSRLAHQLTKEHSKVMKMPAVRTSKIDRRSRKTRSDVGDFKGSGRDSPALMPGLTGFWRQIQGDIRRPESREGAEIVAIGQKLYLLGGASRGIFNDLWVFFPQNWKWIKGETWGIQAEPRMGHSAVAYNSSIVVFGGVTAYNRGSHSRECLNTVKTLRTEGLEWRQVDTTGSAVVMRRYHSAAIVGKHMLVYGGLSEKNGFLGDLVLLNMKNRRWKEVQAAGEGPGAVAFHAAVAVYPGFNSEQYLLFRPIEDPLTPLKYPLPRPGIYLFGGLTASGQALNTLYILETGQRPLQWTKPAVSGSVPSPRFHHSLCLCTELNALVLFGGRNNTSKAGGYSCFCDVHILDLVTLTWTELICQGDVPISRCAHAGAVLGLQLVVFGGVDGVKYCNGDTFVLELDQKVVFECIRERQRQNRRALDQQRAREREALRQISTRSGLRSRSHAQGTSLSLTRELDTSLG